MIRATILLVMLKNALVDGASGLSVRKPLAYRRMATWRHRINVYHVVSRVSGRTDVEDVGCRQNRCREGSKPGSGSLVSNFHEVLKPSLTSASMGDSSPLAGEL